MGDIGRVVAAFLHHRLEIGRNVLLAFQIIRSVITSVRHFLNFSFLPLFGERLGPRDVLDLGRLVSATKQNDALLASAQAIHSVAWPAVDPDFGDAAADGRCVTEMPQGEAIKTRGNPGHW